MDLNVCVYVCEDVVVHCWKLVMSTFIILSPHSFVSMFIVFDGTRNLECGNSVFGVLETHHKIKMVVYFSPIHCPFYLF